MATGGAAAPGGDAARQRRGDVVGVAAAGGGVAGGARVSTGNVIKVDTHGLTPVALAKEVCIYLEGCMPSNSL